MKKVFLALVLTIFTMNAFAQGKVESVLIKGAYQFDAERFGLGAEGRYLITDQIRLAPDVMIFLPKNKVTGLDVNVNAHYVFKLAGDQFSLYPLAGVAMINNRVSAEGFSASSTDWGFNLGAGGSYNLNEKSYLNLELKHTFSDWDDTYLSVGYGIRF